MLGRRSAVQRAKGNHLSSLFLSGARSAFSRGVEREEARMKKDELCAETNEGTDVERLRRTVALCEARLTEITNLTARARHEINNPLTGLIGQAQLLLREDLNDAARRRVEIIEQLAARIRDIVAELRIVQRPNPYTRAIERETDGADEPPPRH